jgi:hypothetical protein
MQGNIHPRANVFIFTLPLFPFPSLTFRQKCVFPLSGMHLCIIKEDISDWAYANDSGTRTASILLGAYVNVTIDFVLLND